MQISVKKISPLSFVIFAESYILPPLHHDALSRGHSSGRNHKHQEKNKMFLEEGGGLGSKDSGSEGGICKETMYTVFRVGFQSLFRYG